MSAQAWDRDTQPIDTSKVIGVNKDAPPPRMDYCAECGCELPGYRATAQTIAAMRFEHHHDCPNHPGYALRRRLAILKAATELYPYEFQFHVQFNNSIRDTEDLSINSAVDIAKRIWKRIEQKEAVDRCAGELINEKPQRSL